MMDRVTPKEWRNCDPWELCGLGEDCNRTCVNNGKWCHVALKLRLLARYEDMGLTPEDIECIHDGKITVYTSGDYITDITGVVPGTPVEVRNYDITHADTTQLHYDSKGKPYYVRAAYDLLRVG